MTKKRTKCAICGRIGRFQIDILFDYEHKRYECLYCIKAELEEAIERIKK